MRLLIYDCEIAKAIYSPKEPTIPGILYCGGWRDFSGMGISCVGAWDSESDQYHVFQEDNRAEFAELVRDADLVCGFNSLAFDNTLVDAQWKFTIPAHKTYDLLVEVWRAAGLGPTYQHPSHAGYGLDALAKANGLAGKTGTGGLAPVLWQQGKFGTVIDYCLRDVWLTRQLIRMVQASGTLNCPKHSGVLNVRKPGG